MVADSTTTNPTAKKHFRDWQRPFLMALKGTGNVTFAASKAGISRDVAYDYRRSNAQFADAWNKAIEVSTDILEEIARKRALKSSDTLLIFLLKARRPLIYRENQDRNLPLPDGATIRRVTIEEVRYADSGSADALDEGEGFTPLSVSSGPDEDLEADGEIRFDVGGQSGR